ncbi:MAG TPA: MAPEG family protein [Woeseiaceae bacterium]|nr:MAPEG family protein [Woeseiaceae bacterium]
MEYVAIVTVLALVQFVVFSALVGKERGKHGIKAPAISGHPDFERAFRVQQNTMEQLVVFLPALWLFGTYVDARIGAVLGLAFIAGRFIYRASYLKDPASRGMGFVIGMATSMALLAGGLIGAINHVF